MEHNIFELQNQLDSAYIGSLNNDFVLQALANLGQRVGLKGDGIVYQNFTFYDMFSNVSETQYPADKYIGVIKYDTDNKTNINIGTAGIIEKGTRYIGATSFENGVIADGTNKIISNGTTSTSISSNFIVNNIQSFLPYSILQSDDEGKYFYNILFGQLINTDDTTSTPNIEVHYNKFRLSDNTLDTAIRVINMSNTTDANYLMYVVTRTFTENDIANTNDNYYQIKAFCFKPDIFGNTAINKNVNQRFNDIFYSRTYISALSSFGLTNLTTEQLENPIDNILFFNKIATNNGIYDYAKYSDFKFYATNESNTFKGTGDDIGNLNKIITSVYSNINVDTLLHYLSNDVNVNFETIFTYFSHNQYNVDLQTLTKKIFFNIYDKVYEDENTYSKGIMYVPLDYKINIIVNSNKQLKIYYSNDFFVTNTNLSSYNDYSLKAFFDNKNNNIIYDYNGLDAINVYNFSFNYNNVYADLINNLTIKRIYSLPSLSALNTWKINNKDTNIYAVGKNAGNPNIIINYNYVENGILKYKVLNKTYDEIIHSVNWIKKEYTINNTTAKQYVYVPDISSADSYGFEYALIFNIDATTNFVSIWNIVINENNEQTFDYIRMPNDDNNIAIDFKSLFTVNSYNNNSNTTVSSINDSLFLTAIDYNIANTFDNINSYFATIKNRSSYFYPTYDINNPYNNNLNLDIRYKTNFNVNSYNNVENIELIKPRYMDELMSIQNNNYNSAQYVTNKIYPAIKTASGTLIIDKTVDKKYEITKYSKITNIDTINIITVYDGTSENTDLTNSANNQIKESLEIIKSSSANTNSSWIINTTEDTNVIEVNYVEVVKLDKNNFFDEYVPNSDVPTLDLGEVLTRNVDVLNRVNLLSINSDGNIYNSYFGTSINDTDKSHLHIGTTSLNINIGKDTLLSYNNTSYFNMATELYDDIPTTFTKRTIFNEPVINADNNFFDSKIKISGDTSYILSYKNYDISANNDYSEKINISIADLDKTKMFLNVIENNQTLINFINSSPLDVDHWNNVINNANVGFDVTTKYANDSVPKEIVVVKNGLNVYRGKITSNGGIDTINVIESSSLLFEVDSPNYTDIKVIQMTDTGIETININDCVYCNLRNYDTNKYDITFNNVSGIYIIAVITNTSAVKFYKIVSATVNEITSTFININKVFENKFEISNPQFIDVLGLSSDLNLDKSKFLILNNTLYYKISKYTNKNILIKKDNIQLYNEYLDFMWYDNGSIDLTIDTEHHDFSDISDKFKRNIITDSLLEIDFTTETIQNILGDNKL